MTAPDDEAGGRQDQPREVDGVSVKTFMSGEDRKRLRMLSIETGKSINELGGEAWAALFELYGLAPPTPKPAHGGGKGRKR
jgi:hypothetical protein